MFLWKADVVLPQSSTVENPGIVSPSPSASNEAPSPPSAGAVSSPLLHGSVVQVTMTLDLDSSVFNTQNPIQPTATADSQPLQTANANTNASNTAEPDLNCADIDWNHPIPDCTDADCVKKHMKMLATMSSCLKDKEDNVTFSKMDIPKRFMSVGMGLAKAIKTKRDNGDDVNDSEVVMTDEMAMEVGVVDSAKYNGTKLELLTFPNYKASALTGKWANMGVSVALPIDELPTTGNFVYAVAILTNVVGDEHLNKADMDWEDIDVEGSELTELYVVDDKLLTRKKPAIKQINSHLISAVFEHGGAELKGPFKKPAEITLNRLHTSEEYFGTTCVFLDGSVWSKDGCDVKTTRGSQTVCKSSHLSTFALISKIEEKMDDSDRKLFVTVATVLGSFSILGLLICAIVAIVITYHQRDNMRIALNIDVSFLLSQLVFFIGLSTSENKFFSNPKTCEVVSPFLHFFELAALTWLLMEGFYYYSTLKPLFNDKNTVPIVFYFAVGWGIPIAFASACAEFTYPHFGIPEKSEFCWMFIRGVEAWYFGAPVLILVLLNLITRAFILREVITWQNDPDDITLERAKTRLVTSMVIMLAIVLTWLFGILAVNHTEDKIYHYFFVLFYTSQGLLVLLFYCIRNQEMWEYRKGKKDEEEKEKNQTYDFVYHP